MSINRLNSKSDKFLLQEIANNTAANGTTTIDKFTPTSTQSSLQAVGIYAENSSNKWQSLNVDSSGNLKVDATISSSGLATSANQTNGNQKCQILGNTIKDGTGTSYHALMDSNGKLIVDGSSVTQPISASSLPLPAGASTASNQSTAIGHLSTIAGDTTSMDGKITQGSDSTLSTTQQVGCYAYNGSSWKQIHSTTGGNLKVSLEELNGSATGQQVMADSIPVVIASDQSAVSVTNAKITQGEGDITGGGNGLQQVLMYGKDQSGNLDPINVDSNGHLKITLNDIESGITSSIKVEEQKSGASGTLYSNASLGTNIMSTVIAIGSKKNLQIVGKTSSSGAKIGIAYQGAGSTYYTDGEYANLYYDGTNYTFAMTIQGIGAQNVKVYSQATALNVDLDYHIF